MLELLALSLFIQHEGIRGNQKKLQKKNTEPSAMWGSAGNYWQANTQPSAVKRVASICCHKSLAKLDYSYCEAQGKGEGKVNQGQVT